MDRFALQVHSCWTALQYSEKCLTVGSTQWHTGPPLSSSTEQLFLCCGPNGMTKPEPLCTPGALTSPWGPICIRSSWGLALASDRSSTTARSVSVSLQASRPRTASWVSAAPGAGWLKWCKDAKERSLGHVPSGLFSWIELDVKKIIEKIKTPYY